MEKYGSRFAEKEAVETSLNVPEKPEPLTYADIVPDYQSMNKNKKKKIRKKFAQELAEKNEAQLKEWEALKKKASQASAPKPQKKPEAKKEAAPIDMSVKKERGPKVDEDIRLKICDLGNGCWTHHHFSSEIQTR